jgi:putative transposase
MAHSIIQVYIHFNWHTRHNAPIISGALERYIHRTMRDIAEDLGLLPLAINSAWNHTHSLYGWSTTVTIEDAVRELKSKTSRGWNDMVRAGEVEGPRLKWQRGIGAFSIHRSVLDRTIAYIDRQKEHHASGKLRPELELKRQ